MPRSNISPASNVPLLYDTDTGGMASTSIYAPVISYGSSGYLTVRASSATGLTTGYSTNSADFVSPTWARGLTVISDVSVVVSATSGNFTITHEVQAKDPLSGSYVSLSSGGWMIGSSSSQNGYNGSTGTQILMVYPGNFQSTGKSISGFVPQVWRVQTVLAGSSFSGTFSVSAYYQS